MADRPLGLAEISDTHTHEFDPPPPTPMLKGLLLAVIALALAVAILSWHIIGRQHLSDSRQHTTELRNERERVAICAILKQIPSAGHPSIIQAKVAFACGG